MPKITLHFDPKLGMDAAAAAKLLQKRCAALAGIASANSTVNRERVLGVDDVILVLTVSAEVFGAGALSLEALRRLIVAVKGVSEEIGLTKLLVEGYGALVKPEELTEADAKFIASATKPTT